MIQIKSMEAMPFMLFFFQKNFQKKVKKTAEKY